MSNPIAAKVSKKLEKKHEQRRSRNKPRICSRAVLSAAAVTVTVTVTTSFAAFPTTLALGSEYIGSVDSFLQPCRSRSAAQTDCGYQRRRGRRKYKCTKNSNSCANLPMEVWNAMNHCRGGGGGSGSEMPSVANAVYSTARGSDEKSIAIDIDIANAHDNTNSMDHSSDVINAGRRFMKRKQKVPIPEPIDEPQPLPDYHQPRQPPRLVIEFDTQAVGGIEHGNSIRNRIRSRIRTDNESWNRLPHHRGPSLSISLDAFSSSPSVARKNSIDPYSGDTTPPQLFLPIQDERESNISNSNGETTLLHHLLLPTQTAIILIAQTAALLPTLLLSRRALNSTRLAIVDYFRGRIFRTTFTNLERAYLRYYEFPAATRAVARLVSQIGILLGLSWVVRWWMILVLMGNNGRVGPMVLGVTGMDVGMVGTSGDIGDAVGIIEAAIGPGWKVGLPCHQRGRGMAWLCGFSWIAAVVGIGHACAMALSVWGGPLRLQAVAQHLENPKHVLRRIIHHPIKWIRELEEWKQFASLSTGGQRGTNGQSGSVERIFNPDPLLFPATWLPLRWLQIFAVAKAFSTDPLQYRWCSPEDDKFVISRLMKQYLVQLALGDEWQRVFLGEKRVGLGIVVVLSYFVALVWMVFTTFTLDGGAAAMLIPSVFAAIISTFLNIMIFWNRLGTREQRRALNAMGWT